MKKLLSLIAIASLFIFGCNNHKSNNGTTANAEQKECSAITVDSFLMIAGDYVGKELTIKGTVDHVCKHGGKRVKLISTASNKFIHGEATEKVGSFKVELEGSDICLIGLVLETKIDLAYVDEWEAKENEALAKNAEESEMKHKEGVDHHANLEQIKKHREDIAASGKGFISFYSLNVTDYHECTSINDEGCRHKDGAENDTIKAPCCEKPAVSACGGCKDEKSGCGEKN